MEKEELLEFHEKMAVIKHYFKQQDDVPNDLFEEYESLNIDPSDNDRSKKEHKLAVFVLGQALAMAMKDEEFSEASRLLNRMEEFSDAINHS